MALVEQRDRSLSEIVSGQPLFYAVLLGLIVVGIKYRERERAWLDRRFFRQEYDARAVLLSLAGRIPYETDPNELTALVVQQIDAALHPTMVAVLVAGRGAGHARAGVGAARHRRHARPARRHRHDADVVGHAAGAVPGRRALGGRPAAARRDRVAALHRRGAVRPALGERGRHRQLLGALVLGGKRSEEPYSSDDRALLSSIAAQVSLGLDVARLRRRQTAAADGSLATALPTTLPAGAEASAWLVAECHVCGTCHDADVADVRQRRHAAQRGRLPRIVDAKYRVDRVLGRGGMGAVYCAHDMRLERDVAIKVVRAELLSDPDARTRFRREAQLVARLQHPGIVSVFDYGTLADGAAFLVMEYVRGRDLRAVLRADGPMPPDRVARLLHGHRGAGGRRAPAGRAASRPQAGEHPAARGAASAPRCWTSASRSCWAATARRRERDADAGGPADRHAGLHGAGAAGGCAVTTRTDVFALGAIAYELLTGRRRSAAALWSRSPTRHGLGPAPIEREDVPTAMVAAIGRALSVDPACGRPRRPRLR